MGYRGNDHLRPATEEISLLPWQQEEIMKCADDPEYFIRNYCYIHTKDAGMQLFNLRPRQAQELKNMQEHRFIKGDWYRQSGYSTTVLAYMLWDTIFSETPHFNVYMGEKEDRAKEEFYKVKQMYLNLPYWMQPGVKHWTNEAICMADGRRFIATVPSPDTVRGFSPYILFVDDFGLYTDNRALNLVQSVFPTIMSGNSRHLITGSSHKFGNQTPFNLTFWKNSEKHFFVSENTWDTDTQHDEEWARAERQKIGDFKFERFYCGKIVQDVMDQPEKEEPPKIFWSNKIDQIPDLIRRTRWNAKFHSRNDDWETINDHLSVINMAHDSVEYMGHSYPALRFFVRNDEGMIPTAMFLEGYVTVDLNIYDFKLGNIVATTRYRCLCLRSLIQPDPLVYEGDNPKYMNTVITLIVLDTCPIIEGAGGMRELPDEADEISLNRILQERSGRRAAISEFLEDACMP
jgi:hypothetical protein